MRILYVINSFDPGGAEHGLLTLVENGFFTGHELKVLAFCRGRHHLATRIADAVGASNLVIASTKTSLTAEACLAGAMALGGQLRRWRPEMVILSLKQANVIGRLVSCFFPSSRCVAYEDISRLRTPTVERVSGYLLRLLSFRVDEIWADCIETLQNAPQYFSGRARRRHIVPMFKADPAAQYKQDYRLHTPLRLVAAGRLEQRKNFHLAIEAVRRIVAYGTDVHLQIFGDGPEGPALQRSIDSRGLGRYVSLAGYRPDWVSQAIARDIFVNLSDTEGFCIVVAEAMAAGLPVIATAVGGVREYGLNGKNMLTLKALDAEALVSHIERLAEDEDVRRRLGERAREDMLAQHSPAAMRARGQSILSDTSRSGPMKAYS
jgi:glycosyltransferase involved in cell wall biosynthesis